MRITKMINNGKNALIFSILLTKSLREFRETGMKNLYLYTWRTLAVNTEYL